MSVTASWLEDMGLDEEGVDMVCDACVHVCMHGQQWWQLAAIYLVAR